jgi:hypothetical protein
MRAIFKTVVEIESSLCAAGVRAADAMVLAARTRPCIWLETTPLGDETEIAFGATKIGGNARPSGHDAMALPSSISQP